MHAYLLVGRGEVARKKEADSLALKLKARLIEFPLVKIEDVRKLSHFVSLSLGEKTAIYIKSIEEATIEASSAFLKNLEEPQENLIYILGASSLTNLLPTIYSRCQVINLADQNPEMADGITEFLGKTIDEKLLYTDTIRKREEALLLLEGVIGYWHEKLIKDDAGLEKTADNLKKAIFSFNSLKANGNVLLQLTNFIISAS